MSDKERGLIRHSSNIATGWESVKNQLGNQQHKITYRKQRAWAHKPKDPSSCHPRCSTKKGGFVRNLSDIATK